MVTKRYFLPRANNGADTPRETRIFPGWGPRL
jgi:hypothetical protein